MRAAVPQLVLLIALAAPAPARAEVYTCIDEKGTRVYSSTRCGPDAQLVPGVGTKKPASAKPGAAATKPARKTLSETELAGLIERCDAGDMKACSQWTLGGGPNLLRERERKAELDCEGGLLAACEERYCREGMNQDCRSRVLRTARLAGETWYLRDESYQPENGLRSYEVRCLPDGKQALRDITVSCTVQAGPNRCRLSDRAQGFDRLSSAAASYCSKQSEANPLTRR
jgi:hypothetical protein